MRVQQYAKTTEPDHFPQMPSVGTLRVTLPVFEGRNGKDDAILSPPSQVLEVAVVGSSAFLSLCTYEEDHNTTKTTEVAHIHVDTLALLNALLAQLDIVWES